MEQGAPHRASAQVTCRRGDCRRQRTSPVRDVLPARSSSTSVH